MANGAITHEKPGITVQPIVVTRKKVPMNSVRYLLTIRYDAEFFQVPERQQLKSFPTEPRP